LTSGSGDSWDPSGEGRRSWFKADWPKGTLTFLWFTFRRSSQKLCWAVEAATPAAINRDSRGRQFSISHAHAERWGSLKPYTSMVRRSARITGAPFRSRPSVSARALQPRGSVLGPACAAVTENRPGQFSMTRLRTPINAGRSKDLQPLQNLRGFGPVWLSTSSSRLACNPCASIGPRRCNSVYPLSAISPCLGTIPARKGKRLPEDQKGARRKQPAAQVRILG